ncbi:MAG: WG repeat-containing protein [Phycisphaerales bacterium]|nr:WG repeat-containing protein [Phycisphaerales bacterium]
MCIYRLPLVCLAVCNIFWDVVGAAPATTNAANFCVVANGRMGVIDQQGRVLQEPLYRRTGCWHEGFLWVYTNDNSSSGLFLDRSYMPLPSPILHDVCDLENPEPYFSQGIAIVRARLVPGNQWTTYAYLDTSGRLLGEAPTESVRSMHNPEEEILRSRRLTERTLLGIRVDGKIGYIDRLGHTVIPPRFDLGWPFIGGFAEVVVGGKHGMIDTNGAYRIPPVYDEISSWQSPPWQVREGEKLGLIDASGDVLIPPWTFPSRYQKVSIESPSAASATWKGKWGVISPRKWTLARVLIPPKFGSTALSISSGYLVRKNREWGTVDANGHNMTYGLDDRRSGRTIVPPRYMDLIVLVDGPWVYAGDVALVCDTYGRWGVLDCPTGRELIPCRFTGVAPWNDLFMAKTGLVIGRPDYLGALGQRDAEKAYPRILKAGQEGCIVLFDKDGNEVLGPDLGVVALPLPDAVYLPIHVEETMHLDKMESGYGVVRGRSGVGVIDTQGRIVVAMEYEDAGILSEGLVPAKQGGRWGYVNLDGKWIVPPRYEEAGAFLNGFAAVRQDGRVGLIDKRSKVRVPFRYADAGYVLNDRFPFADEKDGKRLWGVADLAGNTILPSEYDCVEWIDLEPGTTRYHGKPGWSEF